ncbi:ribosomal protein L3-domain-containing protein [Tuber borchii]|uniref:Ribosomal protein L3-domain-containing protein n=1 Tax=Tuber borchii TaxID=42251 RepID=A0A2T6ZAZ2_TUBBO|nr:ribosomal protein L3-domain-containing protein [Tuber borchii]
MLHQSSSIFSLQYREGDPKKSVHLTAALGHKAGMTTIVRDLDRPEIVEAVTVIETPQMVVVSVVGYVETPHGLRSFTTVWAGHISDDLKRPLHKNQYKSKKKAFTKHAKKHADRGKEITHELEHIKKYCTVLRVLAHSQIRKTPPKQKKTHLIEIQVNGGSIANKVEFASENFENVNIHVIVVTKGRGFNAAEEDPQGFEKGSCIGAWHPSHVQRVYRVGKVDKEDNASTDFNITKKTITPLGGFPRYGEIKNDFVMFKGSIPSVKKRVVTLRKSMFIHTSRKSVEKVELKWVDTSSKFGHGQYQTKEEKHQFLGTLKKDIVPA